MSNIESQSQFIVSGILQIVEAARKRAAIYVNAETTLLYYEIGKFLDKELLLENRAEYGAGIIATVSQQLTMQLGRGYTYSALTRMIKVAKTFNDENMATLSQHLSWSHLIELVAIENKIKRDFYTQLCIANKWGVRELREKADAMLFERTAIAIKPEEAIQNELKKLSVTKEISPDLVFKSSYVLNFLNLPLSYSEKELEQALIANLESFILELGNGFAFLERQKRIPVDAVDYHLDLLFYHRKLRRLVAIDLKLGKFKPEYKAQMELYLRWLQKHEMQAGEETPIGLLLCSEGNTEHVELLMLHNNEIKVAQYFTELPDKAWFADKLHRSMEIAKMNQLEKA